MSFFSDFSSEPGALLEQVMSHISDAVLIVNGDGIIQAINPSLLALLKYESSELTEKSIGVIVNDKGLLDGIKMAAASSESVSEVFESIFLGKEKSRILFSLMVLSEKGDSRKGHVLLIGKKIRVLEINESSLKPIINAQFLVRLNHKLRQPLTPIVGISELLEIQNENLTEEQIEGVRYIHENSQKLIKDLNDIIEMAAMETGRMKMQFSLLDIDSLVMQTGELAERLLGNRDVRFLINHDLSAGEVWIDSGKLISILNHLIENAAFHTSGGEIRLNVSTVENKLFVLLEDTGTGFEAEDVFEKYRTGQLSPALNREGNGLSFCKQIVDFSGGEIFITSEPGKGTQVKIYFPFFTEKPQVIL